MREGERRGVRAASAANTCTRTGGSLLAGSQLENRVSYIEFASVLKWATVTVVSSISPGGLAHCYDGQDEMSLTYIRHVVQHGVSEVLYGLAEGGPEHQVLGPHTLHDVAGGGEDGLRSRIIPLLQDASFAEMIVSLYSLNT
jgi:hypothetical protein